MSIWKKDITENHYKIWEGNRFSYKKEGFSLLELLLTMTIICLLSLLSWSKYQVYYMNTTEMLQNLSENAQNKLNRNIPAEYLTFLNDKNGKRCFVFTDNKINKTKKINLIDCAKIPTEKSQTKQQEKEAQEFIDNAIISSTKKQKNCVLKHGFGDDIVIQMSCKELDTFRSKQEILDQLTKEKTYESSSPETK